MTERVRRSEAVAEEGARRFYSELVPEAAPERNVTAHIVDRAVDEVFREANVTPEVARVMRSLMGSDSASAVAKAFYHGVAAGAVSTVNAGVHRPEVEVSYVLSDEQVAALASYAPDFSLRFTGRELHDHPMAAVCRILDRKLVESRLPPGAAVSHVGGAVVPLVMSGRLGRGHHSCSPLVDRKDMARHVLVNLRLRKLATDVTSSWQVKDAASGYLARKLTHTCGGLAQECSFRTPVLTSVHVYDVPMGDWASIMDRKGAELLEGCMLFPRSLFDRVSGEMETAGARYEVDATRDSFRMGFIDSPSWWYEHSLVEFLKYGVDQVLSSGKATYSYKIVERRGDTIFFRILRVSHRTKPDFVQHYRVPGVEMVRVNGFPVDKVSRSKLSWARRVYLFPRLLWEDMLGHAKESVERGVLSHEKLFNYYRTVAPRQSINAVVVAGGSSVDDLNYLVPLVVHVALFAFMEVKKTQIEAQYIVDKAMADRAREREWTAYKMLAAFGDSLLAACGLTVVPLTWLAHKLKDGATALRMANSYDWDLQPVIQEVSAKLIFSDTLFSDVKDIVADFSEDYAATAPVDLVRAAEADPVTAQFMLDAFSSVLPEEMKAGLEAALPEVEPVVVAPPAVKADSSFNQPSATGSSTVVAVDSAEVARRRQSIQEAIVECESEAAKSEAACADQYRELLVSGVPSLKKINALREMFGNPEFWKVSGGVIVGSLSGAPVEGFQHAAVYSPVPCGGSRLLAVREEEFKGMSEGEYVERVYYQLPDSMYQGWVYTNDSLLIHNGPAVADAMRQALELPLDFSVTLNQGPPGCGKTTSIVNAARLDDVVLVPVRKAARETAQRLACRGAGFAEMVKMRVRTVDSYLVNRARSNALKTMFATRLLADEAFMTREGRWLAAAAHLGVSVIEAYGDKEQIPHVPRAECPKNFVTLRYQTESQEYLTHRCPPELVACWGGVYDWKVRSTSQVKGIVKRVRSVVGMEIPNNCVMMGMYQADKKILKEKYAKCGTNVQVMTVHESEGNTYDHVWLHRFDLRKRTDNFSLYDRMPYALVAMSRSRRSFIYVSPDLDDIVCKWIDKGKDPRRVSAAADISSAGLSKEKG